MTGASAVHGAERIQSLWSGYGELLRVRLSGAATRTAILKWVRPPLAPATKKDISHVRKCRSYDVETAFYREFAAHCDERCRVPRLFGSRSSDGEWLLLLEDLDGAGFAGRRSSARGRELEDCLAWLASFHARFLGVAPTGLWSTGTYWHLATRPNELAAIDDPALREAAPRLDRKLRECRFQTILHGDAKIENFCFTGAGGGVAAVDFQYSGAGCGMKDVAYFLSSCSAQGSEVSAPRHLDSYFERLRPALARRGVAEADRAALEREWRALYPIACADFYRFLAGWAKDFWRADRVGQKLVRDALGTLD